MFNFLKNIFCSTDVVNDAEEKVIESEVKKELPPVEKKLYGTLNILTYNEKLFLAIDFFEPKDIKELKNKINRLLILKKPVVFSAGSFYPGKTIHQYVLPEQVVGINLFVPDEWEEYDD